MLDQYIRELLSHWNRQKTKTLLIALFVIWSAYFVVEYM